MIRVLAAALLLLASSSLATAQTTGRLVLVVVDDVRAHPDEVTSAGRLLRTLRDSILDESDLLSVVSTGRSSVAVDPFYVKDGAKLDAALTRIATTSPAAAPAGSAIAHYQQSQRDATVTLATALDTVRQLAKTSGRAKHVVVLGSRATATAMLDATLTGEPAELVRVSAEFASASKQGGITIHALSLDDREYAEQALRRMK
jgi:hypothetical protein